MRVAVGSGVHVDVGVGVGGEGISRFATVLPNQANAIENANKTNASTSHCPPVRMYARRIRKKETLRADWIDRMPTRAASNAPDTNSATIRMTPTSVLINFEIILPLVADGSHLMSRAR